MAALPSPHLRAPNPFPTLWTALIGMGILTVAALGLSIGQWQRPIAGVLVDPFGLVDNFGWPSWSGYQEGLTYPDRILAADGVTLTDRSGQQMDDVAARALLGTPEAAATSAGAKPGRPMKLLVDQGSEAHVFTVHVERLGFAPWMLLSGGYLLLSWVWLCAAGLLYTARPQSRAVGAFIRWVVTSATILITIFDFHTTRRLVPITLTALACLPSSLIEFGLCFPERLPSLQARPRLLYLLRVLDAVLVLTILGGYVRGHNFRMVTDMSTAAAVVALTVILSLRCATAHGRRRIQLLIALLLLLPLYAVLGTLLLWRPGAAPYLYVAVIPVTVFGALGMGYALLRYDLWDSRTLLRRPGVRPLFTTALSFVLSLLCALGFVVMRRHTDALPIVYVLLAVALVGPLVRRAAQWIDTKLFPTDVHYRDTVEQLSLRFTDLGSQTAVVEAVEQAVRQVVDCARVRLLPMQGPLWTPGNDSAELGRFLPKVAQAMAAAIANEKSGTQIEPRSSKLSAASSSTSGTAVVPAAAATPVERRNLRALRRIVKTASLFALSPEQEEGLARGELVYLTPKSPLVSSVPVLWSWLLIAVRFRDRVVGLLAVAPKSVAQIFTQTSESLLRTIANQAALALYCASVSEQFELLRRTQEGQAHEQLESALAALADELIVALSAPPSAGDDDGHAGSLLEPLRALAAPRPLKRQVQALRPLVERARQLLRDRLLARLLEVDLSPLLEVDCDGEALIQILVGLLANALDACAAPGRVGVTASVETDQRLRISIWDSGVSPLVEGERLLPLVLATDKRAAAFRQIIALRLGRAHGWELASYRRGDRNSTDVLIPTNEWRRRRSQETADEEEEAAGL